MSKTIAFIDIETTGLNPSTNDITQLAVIITDENFNEITRLEKFFDSPQQNNTFYHKKLNRKISYAEFTGLSRDFLKKNQQTKIEDEKEFWDLVHSADFCVSYNYKFERKFLRNFTPPLKWRCLMRTMQNLTNSLSVSEEKMLQILNVPYDPNSLHDAMYDIQCCVESCRVLKSYSLNNTLIPEFPETPTPSQIAKLEKNIQHPKYLSLHHSYFSSKPTLSKYLYSELINRTSYDRNPEDLREIPIEQLWIEQIGIPRKKFISNSTHKKKI